jgi:thymidylate synthase (FAD)
MSARYTPLPDMNYVPTVERLMINASKTNKQAGTVAGSADLTLEAAEAFRLELANEYKRQEDFYQRSLAAGVPKELARVDLPVGRYSRMRASANLLNWLKFLTLRMDENAQWEIRQYANAVGEMIAQEFPRTWELFAEGRAR